MYVNIYDIISVGIPEHVGKVPKSPVPSPSESWHVIAAVPLNVNPASHVAVHAVPKEEEAEAQLSLPLAIVGAAHVIAE